MVGQPRHLRIPRTTFTLPTAGAYTIGVFRISLVAPDEVQRAVFQLQGSLAAAE